MAYTPLHLHHTDAKIFVEEVGINGRKKITVKLKNTNTFMPTDSCETTYPIHLIEKILNTKGPAYLCDEIMRDESDRSVEKHIFYDVFSYSDKEQFKNKSVLDFGCGSAASTMVLSRMLPYTHITGIELEPSLLEIAELRANHHKVNDRVKFLLSPDGNSLPENIDTFDFIFLNAVYEHFLPEERKIILPLLWGLLRPKGILFINQTPYRWFPIETHTTGGLIFINYMPDFFALLYAQYFSKRKLANNTWSNLLRRGIRGGSVREIMTILKNSPHLPILLEPSQIGLEDRIDIWYAVSNKSRYFLIKKCLFLLFKLIKKSTGATFLPELALAIEKPNDT